ncbi:MAG TPA: hypothetical protein VJ806_00455 [Luteimonas sp.]|nr:hypothetical protein [Luteimonas sp.]
MTKTIAPLLALLAFGLIACTASNIAPAATPPPVITLDDHTTQLRSDFNRAAGSVRLLLIVDPACSVCLRGLDDVNKALLKQTDDRRLQTFVVHTSVIGGEVNDVPAAAELLENAHVHHYWDPSGNFGREVSKSLQLKRGNETVYAWDVWMIYDTRAKLPTVGVPSPALFMHQLPKLRGQPGRPDLDGETFGAKARALLAQPLVAK